MSRSLPARRAFCALFSLGLLLPLALAQEAARPTPGPSEPSDEELRRAWKRLTRPQKHEVCEWFRAELQLVDSFQARLVRHALALADRDPLAWPEATPAPWFDPKTHAPAQPIARKPLSASSAELKRMRERFFARVPEPRLSSAWVYDYGARELRRSAPLEDPERIFHNALAGFGPGLDLAEALVELALDDGAQQRALAAFAHAYTDRAGKVYTGLSLYDAHASGSSIEMPDVDCLGIVHEVVGDWNTWSAPVPASAQDALYRRIGSLFREAHRHRGLRRALAQVYLAGAPALRDGYAALLDELHALWESASSTPSELRARLPGAAGWDAFLAEWQARLASEPELLRKGRARRAVLEADAQAVRAAFARVLLAFQASLPTEK